jgi:hypothetical protein
MGYPIASLPDNFKRRMTEQTRAEIGPAAMTNAEAAAKHDIKLEKELHRIFEQWLRLHDLPYVHSAMNKKSTIRIGWPDFTILSGPLACCVEFKAPGGKLDSEQEEVHRQLRERRVPVITAYAVEDAISFVAPILLTELKRHEKCQEILK